MLIDPVVPTGRVLRLEKNNTHGDGLSLPPSLAIRDLAFNMVPDNLVTAFFRRYQTKAVNNGTHVSYFGEQAETPNILGNQTELFF